MLIALVLSGIAEGVGLSAMLPLLAIVLGGIKGTSAGYSQTGYTGREDDPGYF